MFEVVYKICNKYGRFYAHVKILYRGYVEYNQ